MRNTILGIMFICIFVNMDINAEDPCNPGRVERPSGKDPTPPKKDPPYNPKF